MSMKYLTTDFFWRDNAFHMTMRKGKGHEVFAPFGGKVKEFEIPHWRMECPESSVDYYLILYVCGEVHHLDIKLHFLSTMSSNKIVAEYYFDEKLVYTKASSNEWSIINQFINENYKVVYRDHTLSTAYLVIQIGAFLILLNPDTSIAGVAVGEKHSSERDTYMLHEILWSKESELVRSVFLWHYLVV